MRLPEIRFEGLVGLTPPLSCALPLRTGRLFGCEIRRRDYSTCRYGRAVDPNLSGGRLDDDLFVGRPNRIRLVLLGVVEEREAISVLEVKCECAVAILLK